MGGQVETNGGLGFPALDQSDHFLVAGVLEFSDTIPHIFTDISNSVTTGFHQ